MKPMKPTVVPIRQGLESFLTPLDPEIMTDDLDSWWLPNPVQEWVDAVSFAYCVPKVMAIAAAMCAASLLVQGKAKVRVHPAWTEELSLYWLVFAETGMAKSAVMSAALDPIRAILRGIESELVPVIQERTAERARLEAQIARMRRANKAHKYTEGAQEHLQQLRELEHSLTECEVPLIPTWLVTDINPTVVPKMMAHNLSAEGIARVAVCDAEGTFIANMLGRHSGNMNVDSLLSAYSGDPVSMVRTVHGSRELQMWNLPSTHMTVCVMVQPHYLDKLKAHPELGDNGFMGRCLMSRVKGMSEDDPNDPFLRPSIPAAVQAAYAAWLKALAEIPEGTVYQMPDALMGTLAAFHDAIQTNTRRMNGARGWSIRSLGRICRIFAIIAMTDEEMKLMNDSDPGAGRACARGVNILTYLYNCLYSRALTTAQAIEPARAPLPTLCRRLLGWLHRSSLHHFTFRQACQALRVSRDDAMVACDHLCEMGYISLMDEKRRHNQTLTLTYIVNSTDPEGGETDLGARLKRVASVVPQEPDPDEPPF